MRIRHFALSLAFLAVFSVSVVSQAYAYLKIEDSQKTPVALIAGDRDDGRLYHLELKDRDNGKWMFQPAGDGYYYIIDVRHGKAISAGDEDDGKIYHLVPEGRDNAKWKLVEKGDNKFQLIDKKWGKALIAGDDPSDINIYHQAPGLRSNAIWNLTIIDGLGTRPAPKEIVIKEKFLSIKYDVDEKVKDNNSRGTTSTLSAKYTNNTSVAQSQTLAEQTQFTESESWESTEEIATEVWAKVEAEVGWKGSGVNASVSVETGFKTTITNQKKKSNSATYQSTVGFTTNTTIPAGKTTVCSQLVTREKASIPYVVTVLRTFGDGSTTTKTVPGTWTGTTFARSEVTCTENSVGTTDKDL
jgi:hypothetical protein